MIAGTFHSGSGLGNQLFRYLAVRCLAEEKGFAWGMENKELFKGTFFPSLDLGQEVSGITNQFLERKVTNHEGADIRGYDERYREIEDNTHLEGEFQDPRYFMHRLNDIRQWFSSPAITFPIPFIEPKDICVINFRGGDYVGIPELFLPQEYWEEAMTLMRTINPNMRFGVVTDDVPVARRMFPNLPIRHEMSEDWHMIRSAHYLILSNSSFAILPALLNTNAKKIIAPRFWARHNRGYWSMEQNKYQQFTYI